MHVTVPCPNCGAEAPPHFSAEDYNRHTSPEVFVYHKCVRCDLVFLGEIPEDLGRYYPPSYYTIPRDRATLLAKSGHEQYKLDIVKKFVQGGRLLEIGPAWGSFAAMADEAGFEVDVVEMDSRCCDFMERELGLRVVRSGDPVAALESLGSYDVIALWHVIEHVPDPWRLLRAAAARLRPNGVLVLAAPNPDAFQLRLLGARWAHLDAPRHLYLIPMQVLRERMTADGLTVALETTQDPGSVGWNYFGWQTSLRNMAGIPGLLAGRAVAIALHPVESTGTRGACYTGVYRKPA